MEGRTHQLALALLASINVHLHGLEDSVVLGEIFALGHGRDDRAWNAGRQQPNAAKVGRCPETDSGRSQGVRIVALAHVYRVVSLSRDVLHRRRALQLVPSELATFQRSLQRLEQHDRKQLTIGEPLEPDLAE